MGPRRIQTAQPGDINVRLARPDERGAIFTVFYQSVRDGSDAYYNEAQRTAWAPKSLPDSDVFDAQDTRLHWVAEVDGEIVGFMALEVDGYLDLAFVLPQWMGRGVAQAIYEPLLEWARAAGLKRLTTDASHFARRFFTKQGWQMDSPEIYAHNGQEFERFHMSLELENPDEETL